jgi:hypothetical protein
VSRAQLVFVLSVADDVREEQDLSSDRTETCSEERAKSGSVAGRDLREDRFSGFDQLARAYQRPARGAATTGCRICLDRDLEATSRASAQHDQRRVGSEDANVVRDRCALRRRGWSTSPTSCKAATPSSASAVRTTSTLSACKSVSCSTAARKAGDIGAASVSASILFSQDGGTSAATM